MKFGAIILAAGYSSRMKKFKPLMQIGGKCLLARCAALFEREDVSELIVVSGYKAKSVAKEARSLGVKVVNNSDYADGMYSSIRFGVQNISGVDGFFLLPVDIPLVRPATVNVLINHFDGKSVLFPCFKKMRGHPPLIPVCFIPEIIQYSGKGGLKRLLEGLDGRDVPVWDQSVLMDMDRPKDYEKLVHYHSRMHIGTREECAVLASVSMEEKGLCHGQAVAEAAMALGQALNANGYNLNLTLLYNGGLLHDIAKGQPKHEKKGRELLCELGFAGLADCVGGHRDVAPPRSEKLTEVELVCLADKLVCGSRIVSVEHRYEEKCNSYKDDPAACEAIRKRMVNGLKLKEIVERTCGRTLHELLESGKV